jgi:hypothetical protein
MAQKNSRKTTKTLSKGKKLPSIKPLSKVPYYTVTLTDA